MYINKLFCYIGNNNINKKYIKNNQINKSKTYKYVPIHIYVYILHR